MFGYVKPDLPYLYLKDDKLYKALYCGVCKSIGKTCGQKARLSLTYDIAFLSAFAHNLCGKDVTIKKEHCIVHPLISRPMASRDEITETMACVNVALAYFKVQDDISDEGKGKLKRLLLSSGYKAACKKNKRIAEIVRDNYRDLRALEKNGESSIDRVSEPFSIMMKDLSVLVLEKKATEATGELFYYLGKWIYLVDALDDYEKDIAKGDYNPFYLAYGNQPDFGSLIKAAGKDLNFVFSDLFTGIRTNLSRCEFAFNHDLIDNILLRGLPETTLAILKKGNEK